MKTITHKEFMRALKKRTEADLIISRYNLQETLKYVEQLKKDKNEIPKKDTENN